MQYQPDPSAFRASERATRLADTASCVHTSREAKHHTPSHPTATSAQVLTSGMWPQTTAAATCNLPRELEQSTQEFVAYYLHANSGGFRGFYLCFWFLDRLERAWSAGACCLLTCTPTRVGLGSAWLGCCCTAIVRVAQRCHVARFAVPFQLHKMMASSASAAMRCNCRPSFLSCPRRPAADVADGAGHGGSQGHVWRRQPQARDPVQHVPGGAGGHGACAR